MIEIISPRDRLFLQLELRLFEREPCRIKIFSFVFKSSQSITSSCSWKCSTSRRVFSSCFGSFEQKKKDRKSIFKWFGVLSYFEFNCRLIKEMSWTKIMKNKLFTRDLFRFREKNKRDSWFNCWRMIWLLITEFF